VSSRQIIDVSGGIRKTSQKFEVLTREKAALVKKEKKNFF
jgi:hypothetical protein